MPWPIVEGTRGVDHLITAFVEALAAHRGAAPATIKSYRDELFRLLRFARARALDADPRQLTRPVILEYLAAPVRAGAVLSPTGRNKRLAVLRSFFGWMASEQLVEANPAASIAWTRVPRREPDFLTSDEARRLVDAAMSSPRRPWNARNAALVAVLFHVGLRVSEVVNLDLWQVDLDTQTLRQVRRKRGRVQDLSLNDVACGYLAIWLAQRRLLPVEDSAVFATATGKRLGARGIQMLLKRIGRHAGIARRVWPHLVRHGHCTEAQVRGAPIRAVALNMGHEDLETTARYSHATRAMQRAAVDVLVDPEWRAGLQALSPSPAPGPEPTAQLGV